MSDDDFWAKVRQRVEAFEKNAPQWLLDAVNADGGPLVWGDARSHSRMVPDIHATKAELERVNDERSRLEIENTRLARMYKDAWRIEDEQRQRGDAAEKLLAFARAHISTNCGKFAPCERIVSAIDAALAAPASPATETKPMIDPWECQRCMALMENDDTDNHDCRPRGCSTPLAFKPAARAYVNLDTHSKESK